MKIGYARVSTAEKSHRKQAPERAASCDDPCVAVGAGCFVGIARLAQMETKYKASDTASVI